MKRRKAGEEKDECIGWAFLIAGERSVASRALRICWIDLEGNPFGTAGPLIVK